MKASPFSHSHSLSHSIYQNLNILTGVTTQSSLLQYQPHKHNLKKNLYTSWLNEKSTTQPQRNWINPRSLYAYRTATLHNRLKHYDLSDVTPLQLLLWDQPLNHIGCKKNSMHDSWLQTQPLYHNDSIKVQFMANWLRHSLTF